MAEAQMSRKRQETQNAQVAAQKENAFDREMTPHSELSNMLSSLGMSLINRNTDATLLESAKKNMPRTESFVEFAATFKAAKPKA